MKIFDEPKFNHPGFNFFLRRSTYVHIALVATTLIGGKVAFDINRAEREKNLELIQASVRVEMVAMPTHTLNELKNLSSGVEEAKKEEKTPELAKPTEKEEIKEEPKAEKVAEAATNEVAFEEAAQAKKRKEFLSKLKTIGSKKVESTGTQKAEKGLYGKDDSALKDLVLSGNKLSKGTSMYGDGNAAEMTAFQAYASRLPDLIRPHWRLPDFLMGKNLKARVRVWLNMSGEVTRATIYQSSGDSEFDQRAVDAVKSAAPFPALKDEFGKRALNGDILLGFPL
jgi:colicin import membrane protein